MPYKAIKGLLTFPCKVIQNHKERLNLLSDTFRKYLKIGNDTQNIIYRREKVKEREGKRKSEKTRIRMSITCEAFRTEKVRYILLDGRDRKK